MKKRQTKKYLTGFTLIEVMVALTIIAISLGALISTSGTQASSATYLKQKTLAHLVAMNEVAELHIAGTLPDVGDKKGSTKMANHEWYWIRTTKKTEQDNTRQVSYKVFADKEYEQSLTSFIDYVTFTNN